MAKKSFDPATDIPDLSGKVIVVTGGSSGLGAASIRAFAARKPAQLWLAARTRSTAEATVSSIKQAQPDADIRILDLDLGSLASVTAAAAALRAATAHVDILMLNAGIASTPPALSPDGFELQLATNYLGHALLTQLLLPALRAAPAPRVVALASNAHRFAPAGGLQLDRARSDMAANMGMVRYGHSKLAVALWARTLAARYPGVRVVTIDPGAVDTGLVRGGAQAHPWLGRLAKPLMRVFAQTADAGARSQLWGAVSPDAKSGVYYEPVGNEGSPSKFVTDDKLAQTLWDWTDAQLKEHGAAPGWPAAAASE